MPKSCSLFSTSTIAQLLYCKPSLILQIAITWTGVTIAMLISIISEEHNYYVGLGDLKFWWFNLKFSMRVFVRVYPLRDLNPKTFFLKNKSP